MTLPISSSQSSTATRKSRSRIAVLVVNLGTPDAPTPGAVWRYLREFLSDPRVVELPRVLWWVILNGLVLPLRVRAVAKKYASIWLTKREGAADIDIGSPLRVYSQMQARALQARFQKKAQVEQGVAPVHVVCAMRYGQPALTGMVRALQAQGVDRLLILPLYPQYSATTTASIYDALFAELTTMRAQSAIRTISDYHAHPAYIAALRAQVEDYWRVHGIPNFAAGDKLLLSFHGLPQRCITLGDPYERQCLETARLLLNALQLNKGQSVVSFQSRFGKAQWLAPYTAQTLTTLGHEGVGRVDVFCPGFPADCLETLEEIAIEGRELFLHAGGRHYHAIPCLNGATAWIDALDVIACEHLQGWM
ncbi:MAG: ferrochelatase [Ottowia sp.]|nr:ferrochelatase [Ottowia sp.]